MRIPLLLALTFFFCAQAFGQHSLSGTVADAETGEPVFGANIFIQNTTIGTTSDPDGKFSLEGVFGDYAKVVISHISYKSKTLDVNGRKVINFKLQAKIKQLETVEIEREKDRKWKRFYTRFEEAFIGKTQNAEQVTVTNPWVMEFEKGEGEGLNGYSLDLLEIENKAIGYQIKFLMESFKLSVSETIYKGKPLFTPMEPGSDEEAAAWEEARKKTYLGSKQHFLYALAQNRIIEEGFELYMAQIDQKSGRFKTLNAVTTNEIFKGNRLAFDGFLKVVYTREKPDRAFVRAASSTTRIGSGRQANLGIGQLVIENNPSNNEQVSFLFNRSSRGVAISDQGVLKTPEGLLEYGYWGWERIAELMPYEYHLNLDKQKED